MAEQSTLSGSTANALAIGTVGAKDMQLATNGTVRLTINGSNGAITSSSQPGFLAYNLSDDTLVGNDTTIEFNIEPVDDANNFASNTFTAPVTGRYLLIAHVQYSTGSTTANRALDILTTARRYPDLGFRPAVGASEGTTHDGSVIADMSAGDTAVIRTKISSGTVTVVGNTSMATWFAGRLLP